jgi:hypothetical protein
MITDVDFNTFGLFEPNNQYKVFQRDKIQVEIENNKIKNLSIISTESNKLIISGVLEINSKIVYGYDKQKRPYKLFTPFNNKLFPKFLIAYTYIDKINYNKIITIKFKSWNIEYPIGEIVESYGYLNPDIPIISLIESYSKSLLFYSGFNYPKRIKLNYNINELKTIFDNSLENKENFHQLRSSDDFLMICNIDPSGCTDIDDVISYSEQPDGIKIIGIHICDIIYVLSLFGKYFPKFINEIYSNMFNTDIYATVYTNSKPFGIISDKLIDNFLTLKCNEQRYVWSTYIYIKDDIIINTICKPEIITNKKTYTYDEADKILLSDTNTYIKIISDFTIKYGKEFYPNIYSTYDNHEYNSHYMISLLMTYTNHYVGNLLINDNKTIYRSTIIKTDDIILGLYNLNKLNNTNCTNHHSLININNYTHFTSPIRRFIDQYVHYRLYRLYELNFNKSSKIDQFAIFDNLLNMDENKINIINRSLTNMKIVGNQFKLLSLIKSNTENIYQCKLININYDEIENKLYLKWLVNSEIKIFDLIKNPLIEFQYANYINGSIVDINSKQSIILYNRLNIDNNKIILSQGNNYMLKFHLLLLNNMKTLKISISYF